MKERIDTALYLINMVYAFFCVMVRISVEVNNELPDIFYTVTFSRYYIGTEGNDGYDLILLAVLVVFRFILFGKTYQK